MIHHFTLHRDGYFTCDHCGTRRKLRNVQGYDGQQFWYGPAPAPGARRIWSKKSPMCVEVAAQPKQEIPR